MKIIRKSYEINVSVGRVWEALTKPSEIENWGAGPAKMDNKTGTRFELWGGDIHGINTEVTEYKKLIQNWYAGDWPEASKVVIELSGKDNQTKVTLEQTGVPDKEFDEINDAWDKYYFGPMKEYLENN